MRPFPLLTFMYVDLCCISIYIYEYNWHFEGGLDDLFVRKLSRRVLTIG
jgi:hypothetical protein